MAGSSSQARHSNASRAKPTVNHAAFSADTVMISPQTNAMMLNGSNTLQMQCLVGNKDQEHFEIGEMLKIGNWLIENREPLLLDDR